MQQGKLRRGEASLASRMLCFSATLSDTLCGLSVGMIRLLINFRHLAGIVIPCQS